MNREDCKEGVRVLWIDNKETGTIVPRDGSIFYEYNPDWVWVKWDQDGEVLNIDYGSLIVLEPSQETKVELTEE